MPIPDFNYSVDERHGVVGLGDDIGSAQLLVALNFMSLGLGCHEDDGCCRQFGHILELVENFDSVHARHHDVQQNEIRLEQRSALQSSKTAATDIQSKASEVFQNHFGYSADVGVIFNVGNPCQFSHFPLSLGHMAALPVPEIAGVVGALSGT